MSISIVIPCHNEESAVDVVLGKIAEVRRGMPEILEVLVVDDGSTDASPRILATHPDVKVLRSETAGGYGAALKKGFREARGELILFMDMDDTYDIRDLPALYREFRERNLDVIYGNRLTAMNGMPWVRRLGNSMFRLSLKAVFRHPVSDPCSGMSLFKSSLKHKFCEPVENDLSYSMALTVRILRMKIRVGEMPIRYHERIGESKLNSFSDGCRFLWSLLSNRFSA
ncbi:MAG TPA: glycosyltransferase family 2 protein [Pseudobdellovibrionaceae bacterium]|nr:glycosyltransferase family 2 protein [Pseudobdellovibrionaceae bacterium]